MSEQSRNSKEENRVPIDYIKDKYNKIYSENEVTFGKGKPEKIIEDIIQYCTSGSVLELGAGEGRNSLFLAGHGLEVTAKDISDVGVDKINKLAEAKGLNIKAEVADVSDLSLDNNFDVLISTFMLHHLSRREAIKLIEQMKEHTNVDGLNAITAFTKNGDFFKRNPETDDFYPEEGELKDIYSDCEILEYEEVEGGAFDKNPDGSPILNISAKILAKKLK